MFVAWLRFPFSIAFRNTCCSASWARPRSPEIAAANSSSAAPCRRYKTSISAVFWSVPATLRFQMVRQSAPRDLSMLANFFCRMGYELRTSPRKSNGLLQARLCDDNPSQPAASRRLVPRRTLAAPQPVALESATLSAACQVRQSWPAGSGCSSSSCRLTATLRRRMPSRIWSGGAAEKFRRRWRRPSSWCPLGA
jgi:hypothetical protein